MKHNTCHSLLHQTSTIRTNVATMFGAAGAITYCHTIRILNCIDLHKIHRFQKCISLFLYEGKIPQDSLLVCNSYSSLSNIVTMYLAVSRLNFKLGTCFIHVNFYRRAIPWFSLNTLHEPTVTQTSLSGIPPSAISQKHRRIINIVDNWWYNYPCPDATPSLPSTCVDFNLRCFNDLSHLHPVLQHQFNVLF